jgi:hypothetical protein
MSDGRRPPSEGESVFWSLGLRVFNLVRVRRQLTGYTILAVDPARQILQSAAFAAERPPFLDCLPSPAEDAQLGHDLLYLR